MKIEFKKLYTRHASKNAPSRPLSLPPSLFQGLWGVLLMLFLVFPLAFYLPGTDTGGSMENIWDSLAMVRTSQPLQWVLLAFFLSVRALPPSLPSILPLPPPRLVCLLKPFYFTP